jgi:hypothetical protein
MISPMIDPSLVRDATRTGAWPRMFIVGGGAASVR